MTETINFNSANAVSENVNVANATSENDNVVIATSEKLNVANSESEATSKKPAKKKATKKMKLNESISKRVLKDGKYKTDKFKIVAYAKKLNMKESEIEKAFGRLLTNSIAA